MPKFKVSVEKRLYYTGTVEVEAKGAVGAIAKVNRMIANGKLQSASIAWDDGEYEDFSFKTTGDVD
jgi:hypothetical protein